MFKELIFLALLAYASAAPQRYQGNYQQQPPQQQGPPPQYAQQPPQGPPPQYAQQPPQYAQQPPQGPPQGPPPQPIINWNRCPQLEPSMEDKIKKASVINKCLEMTPVPENITRETVELHREQVAGCALQYEGWFNEQGLYRFDKAESEIRAKKLSPEIEPKVIAYHNQCKNEANEKFPPQAKNVIAQVQLYQACMDYFISEVCGIEVSIPGLPQGQQQPGQQGPPPQHAHQHPPRQYQ